jgi:hypothetical protein
MTSNVNNIMSRIKKSLNSQMISYEVVKYKPGVGSLIVSDSRSTISLDIKLPIGYSLIALVGDILYLVY